MKCKIPSYISDFIMVDMWRDTDNFTYYPNATEGLMKFNLKFERKNSLEEVGKRKIKLKF